MGYKGAANSVTDLVGGQVQLGFNAIPSVITFIKSGKLVALATAGEKRSSLLPNVPTLAETVPGFSYTLWYGLFAPAKTPTAVVDKVAVDLRKALSDPEVQKLLLAQGSDPAPSTAQELSQQMARETQDWSKAIKDRNLKFD